MEDHGTQITDMVIRVESRIPNEYCTVGRVESLYQRGSQLARQSLSSFVLDNVQFGQVCRAPLELAVDFGVQPTARLMVDVPSLLFFFLLMKLADVGTFRPTTAERLETRKLTTFTSTSGSPIWKPTWI